MMRHDGESAWDYLERIPSVNRKKSSLLKVREFLGILGNPDREFKIIHVAGTNGKGSVCAMMTSCLVEAGMQVGTFISPHLVDIRERFLLNGQMVSQEAFDESFEIVYKAISQWVSDGNLHPTYFEFLFYMAMVLFKKAGIQVLVLETGMGGRFDVTNVIEKPLVSVITSISIDHTAFLGETKTAIAEHKAGIIKPGCPVVYDSLCEEVVQVFRETAKEMESPSFEVGEVPFVYEDGEIRIALSYNDIPVTFDVPFAAPYQARNAALAVRALEQSGLGLTGDAAARGLKKAKWPARMEQIQLGVFLDGAHNEDGIREFLKAACMIRDHQTGDGRTWLVFAVASDKEYREMLTEIGETLKPDVCMLASMESYRALSMEELYKTAKETMVPQTEIRCFESTGDAVRELFHKKEDGDLTFIAGSLYLAGEVKAVIAEVLEEKHD